MVMEIDPVWAEIKGFGSTAGFVAPRFVSPSGVGTLTHLTTRDTKIAAMKAAKDFENAQEGRTVAVGKLVRRAKLSEPVGDKKVGWGVWAKSTSGFLF